MKTRFFVPFFLLIFLSLPAAPVSKRLVVGDAVIESQITDGLLAGTTTRVSVASDGTQGNHFSGSPSISANGRYVAFDSLASNLVPGDTNEWKDIFVHDRQTGQTSRVSVASDGTQGNGVSGDRSISISADGNYVAFESWASNLVPGDTNGTWDIFVHDRQTEQTSRVSVASDGTQGNSPSLGPSISADGRYVAFLSYASNLVPSDTNGALDAFVHDRQTGQTTRVSVATDGTQGNGWSQYPSISADGRYVAFESEANNLVAGDTNGWEDIFVHDRQTGQTSRMSVASDGTQGNHHSEGASISADGRYVAFYSLASNLVPGDTNSTRDVFVHDRQTGQTTRVSVATDGTQGNGESGYYGLSISANGRYVVFASEASNLVPGNTNGARDVFVHDQQTGQTSLLSVTSGGAQGNAESRYPSISADGRYVTFASEASNLVPDDTNGVFDVFVHDRQVGTSVVIPPDQAATLTYTATQGLTTTIHIPAGAVVDETLLVYTPLQEVTPPAGLHFAGRAFELTAYQNDNPQPDFTFLQPITVSLTYHDEQVVGLQEDALSLQLWHEMNWMDAAETCLPVSGYVRDATNNTLSVNICHLSQFALMGQPDYSIFLPHVVSQAQP